MQVFERFAAVLEWRDFDKSFWNDMAAAWVALRRKGRPFQDADLMIAIFAQRLGATVVTHNISDFRLIDAAVVDWCS